MSRLGKSSIEGECEIRVLRCSSSEEQRQVFAETFPYWSRSLAQIIEKAEGGSVAFVSYGTSFPIEKARRAMEKGRIDQWVLANAFDEWTGTFSFFEEVDAKRVEWVEPDWPGLESGDEKEHLLLIGDARADFSLLEPILKEAFKTFKGLPVRTLNLARRAAASEALSAVSRAKACISLQGDRQMEHWLYKAALEGGCEAWGTTSGTALDTRYLGDQNPNRVRLVPQSPSKLRPTFDAIRSFRWEGFLEREAYQEKAPFNDAFLNWLRRRSALAIEFAGVVLAPDPVQGHLSTARVPVSIIEILEGNADPKTLAPLLESGEDSRRVLFEELAGIRYSSEWAEVFLHRSFRDRGFLSFAINEARKKSSLGARAVAKIGGALVEQLRLSVFGYDEELPKLALDLLRENWEGMGESAEDFLCRAGLAASLAESDLDLNDFAATHAERYPGSNEFTLFIATHWLQAEDFHRAMVLIDRLIETNGPSDRALLLKIDLRCQTGDLEGALEIAERFKNKSDGLSRIATAPLRSARVWNTRDARISNDDLTAYLDVCEGIETPDHLVNRAIALYALRSERWELAEVSLLRWLEEAPDKRAAVGQLQMNLARLGVDPGRFDIAALAERDTGWVKSLDDALVFAMTVSLEGKEDQLAELKSMLDEAKGLDRLAGIGSLTEANAVRCHALMLMNLIGLPHGQERETLAGRLLPKYGRSLDRLPDPLEGSQRDALDGINPELGALTRRACQLLEPRFINV